MRIAQIEETHDHSIPALLKESFVHETNSLNLYKALLKEVEGESVYLEEYTRGMIGQEEMHVMELRKMIRDYDHEA